MTLAGGSLGQIRVLGPLGAGGMGEVFAGFDERLQRRVALKAIHRRRDLDPVAKARFLREARILSQLDHPNICRIYDYVEGEERDFLVLELVEGKDLGGEMAAGMRDSLRLDVAEQVAQALAAAHQKGVVHRDLKPQNVMVTAEGRVKVLDFGLARSLEGPPGAPVAAPPAAGSQAALPETVAGAWPLSAAAREVPPPSPPRPAAVEVWAHELEPEPTGTMLGAIVGTLDYMSPEQARGEAATTASDLYAFGLLLQELFTGTSSRPPSTDAATRLRHAQLGHTVAVRGIDKDVAALVERLLDPSPAARPTAVEALARLRWIQDKPRRRLIRLGAAAALALLFLGGAKYVLDLRHARAVAERHRAQAEDLIGFMLGDLKDKLAPVGRLELLEDVGDKAMSYFASLPREDRTDDELFRHSQALRQIGEVRMAKGDLPAAKAAFADSFALSTSLVERDPVRPPWLLGLAHSHFWLGNVDLTQGDLAAALRHNEEYRRLARRLVQLQPDNTQWRLEEAYAETNLAAIHDSRGEGDAALASLRAAIAVKQELVSREPGNREWRSSLANGLSWLGSMLIARGDLAGAAANFTSEEGIRRRLAKDEAGDTGARYLLAVNLSHQGPLDLMVGEAERGAAALRESIDLFKNLVAQDPLNSDWQRDLAVTRLSLAELELVGGRGEPAAAELVAAGSVLQARVAGDPTNADWRQQLAACHVLESTAARAAGRGAAAVEAARPAVALLEPLLAASTKRRSLQLGMVRARLALGDALASVGEPVAAREAWEAAYAVLAPTAPGVRDTAALDPAVRDPAVLDLWGGVLLRLGRRQAAAAVAARLVAAGYRRPDFIATFRGEGLLPRPAADGS